ncbi:DNA-directed RNA polymerase subunit omega [Lentibacillus halophilus]|uniref:DNA-directed RNA polymerase subunit omega n=1 Tax=Lentibacillus halophilus TaxID=295065 RepID=A0ABN0ZG67_9BACI
MMLEPSIDDLQKTIKSKYTLVTIAAKRAHELQHTNNVLVDSKSNKYVGQALDEIHAGKLFVKDDSK